MPNVFPWSPWWFFFSFFNIQANQFNDQAHNGNNTTEVINIQRRKTKEAKRDLLSHPNLQNSKCKVFNHILSKRTIRNTGMIRDSVNFNTPSTSFQNKLGQWRKKEMRLHLSIFQSAECEESWCNPQGSWARSGTARKMLLPSYRAQVKSHWKNPAEAWSVIFKRCRKKATRLSSEVKHLQGEKSNRAWSNQPREVKIALNISKMFVWEREEISIKGWQLPFKNLHWHKDK